jgi:hypothetical protein
LRQIKEVVRTKDLGAAFGPGLSANQIARQPRSDLNSPQSKKLCARCEFRCTRTTACAAKALSHTHIWVIGSPEMLLCYFEALPLTSTRNPVGFGVGGLLVTTKSSVFTPATNPLLIVNGVKVLYPDALMPRATPFNMMTAELSAAN